MVKALALAALLAFEWQLPPGFPLPQPAPDNRMSAARFELGRHLFYDERLSADGTRSCASCHQQSRAFTDGKTHTRNTMTLTNVVYNASFTWSNPDLRSLERHALVPMFNELGFRTHKRQILLRLRDYQSMFEAAFPDERISVRNIARALAAFERAMISGRSPYDRVVYDGEHTAMSDTAWRGMQLFFSERAGCAECHGGFNFSGAVRYAGGRNVKPSFASNGITSGRFRVPTLRNVALTAPYMHDGSIATLPAVIDAYSAKRAFTAQEKTDLLHFLDALTDIEFVHDARFSDPRR